MRQLFLLLLVLHITQAQGQDTGQKSFPALGITLTIPNNWVGQENEIGYAMGSYTEPGLIMVIPHQTRELDQLKQEARQGLADEQGTMLQLHGDLDAFGAQGIQAHFQGTISWQPAKAYAVGLINPHGGTGITILAISTVDQFTDMHKTLPQTIAESVIFEKVATSVSSINKSTNVAGAGSADWAALLQNARLTYMNSYYSNSGSYDGYSTGGGYSDKEVIDLCAQGYFRHSNSSSLSIDTGGTFGSSYSSGQGDGTWKVTRDNQGQAILELTFLNGKVSQYVLALEDGKTFLNGYRYYRTYGTTTDDGPDCF